MAIFRTVLIQRGYSHFVRFVNRSIHLMQVFLGVLGTQIGYP